MFSYALGQENLLCDKRHSAGSPSMSKFEKKFRSCGKVTSLSLSVNAISANNLCRAAFRGLLSLTNSANHRRHHQFDYEIKKGRALHQSQVTNQRSLFYSPARCLTNFPNGRHNASTF